MIVQNPSSVCYMGARLKKRSAKRRSGSRSGHKGRVILPNNDILHSRRVTRVLLVFLGVEFDGDTYFIIRATVWPKMMSTCTIMALKFLEIDIQM